MAKKPTTIPAASQDIIAKKLMADFERFSMRENNWDGHNCGPLPKHICVAASYFVNMVNDFIDEGGNRRAMPSNPYHIPNIPDRNGEVKIPNSLLLGWLVQGGDKALEVVQSIIFHDAFMHYSDRDKKPVKIKIDELFTTEREKVLDLINRLPVLPAPTDDIASKIQRQDEVKESSISIGVALDKAKQEGTIYGI